jgi:penicillin-binding protein 1A
MTAVWVGYDKPKSLGVSSTGGKVALPIWMSYMKEAVPKSANRPFPPIPGAQYASIDESTGRVASGGRSMPFLSGTVPESSGGEIGQATSEDMLTRDF